MKLIKLLFVLALVAAGTATYGDQLAWLEEAQCDAALAELQRHSFVVLYCSRCEDPHVSLWQITSAIKQPIQGSNLYEIALVGRPIMRTKQPAPPGKLGWDVDYEYVGKPTSDLKVTTLDLAYVYIPIRGEWRCLGKHLQFRCEVNVEKFLL